MQYKDLQTVTTTSNNPVTSSPLIRTVNTKTSTNPSPLKSSISQGKKTLGKGKNAKLVDKGKKHVVISTPSPVTSTSTGPSSNLRNKIWDKAKVTAALIQELTEELQSMDQESLNDEHESEVTQESNLEQEDSEDYLTEMEELWLNIQQNLSFPCCEPQKIYEIVYKNTVTKVEENIEDSTVNHAEEVVIRSEQGTTFPMKVGSTLCNTLINTGATRSCMSEAYYWKLHLNKICLLSNIRVRSATGSNLSPLGIVDCTFELGKIAFTSDFIVCKNLTRPLILGQDFLMRNQVTVRYSKDGKCILDCHQEELIASLEIENKPQLTATASVLLPGRTLAVIQVNSNLEPEQSGQIYEIEPNNSLLEEYPNLYIVPMVYNVDTYTTESVPMVLINFSVDDISFWKGEVVGFLQNQPLDISEIRTETSTEPSPIMIEEDYVNEVFQEQGERKFITSPADIEVYWKVELQDADVSEKHQIAFGELCKEFKDIFSVDSSDIGKSPLVEMEIDTGDSPPITQKPYTLPLKHAEWVQKELEILEKAGVIVRSVSPWASPIGVVPKRTAPGEPPKRRLCVDYRAINSLLPPVKKAFSEAKGILTFVPLPKIDEIYACLKDSKIYSTFDMQSGYYHMVLSEESRPKSAFVSAYGKWEFKRCPFGLAQAPAYFQRLINEVLLGLTFAFGYLDNILVFSPDMETHLKHLRVIFERLRSADLKLKEVKCNFLKKHIQHLGHIISGEGYSTSTWKIREYTKNVTTLKSQRS